MIANRNVLWGRAVAQEIARGGVQHVCVAPGSRSTPLVLALHEQTSLRLSTHLDERGAGFFALGIAKATRRPVVVVVTSGTAVANLLPAVVEAHHARVPLLVLTADRPPELLDVGANQAVDQSRIFGDFVRFRSDVGIPEPLPARIRHLRALIGRAIAHARGPPAGPVHLNFPFREPLEPREVPGDVPADWARGDAEAENGRLDGQPFLVAPKSIPVPDPDWTELAVEAIKRRPNGIIVVGPRDANDALPAALAELAHRTGYPILADALSGLRFGAPAGTRIVSAHDAFLAHAPLRARLRPELVLRFGGSPTSRSLHTFLQESTDAFQVVIDESGRLGEETTRAHLVLGSDPTAAARALTRVLPTRAPGAWATAWHAADATAWRVLANELDLAPIEGAVVARLARELPENSLLFVSNSMPVRDLERFARSGDRAIRVLANRGASGIDGIVSTALGAAYGTGRRVTLLLGDLAFLHDLNGFVAARRLGIPIDVVLLNNDGGGIFEFLPVSRVEPPFTELFVTPHGLDVGGLAKAVGLRHTRAVLSDPKKVPLAARDAGLLEIVTDRAKNVEGRRRLEAVLGPVLDKEVVVPAD